VALQPLHLGFESLDAGSEICNTLSISGIKLGSSCINAAGGAGIRHWALGVDVHAVLASANAISKAVVLSLDIAKGLLKLVVDAVAGLEGAVEELGICLELGNLPFSSSQRLTLLVQQQSADGQTQGENSTEPGEDTDHGTSLKNR
jgi:hypothetical protein